MDSGYRSSPVCRTKTKPRKHGVCEVFSCPKSRIGLYFGTDKEAQDGFVIFNDVLLYKYCGSDENVVIPDGVETLCSRSFWSAPDVKTVELPESVKDINNAFEYSGVTKLLVPDNADPETDMKYEDYRKLRRYKS